MQVIESIIQQVSTFDGVTIEPHRFGGLEFKYGRIEIGHIHRNGVVDIPFTKRVRQQLITENQAQRHPVLPDSGWTSFFVRDKSDVDQALWLLKLSYLAKRLSRTRSAEEREVQQRMLETLDLSQELSNLVHWRVNSRQQDFAPSANNGSKGDF